MVRQHRSAHDTIASLPLVTREAVVADREAVDRHRSEEARTAVERVLRSRPAAFQALAADGAYERLVGRLAADGHGRLARRVETLRDRIERPWPMVVRIGLSVPDGFEYAAGQYVGLRYGDTSRAYSLASAPSASTPEVCVRRVPDGRLSPQLCETLQVGDQVTLRGPYGELVFDRPSTRDVAFLATGTGVAPFRGMIQTFFEEGRDVIDGHERDVWLFAGAAWADDLPYRQAFRSLAAERDQFHYVPCVTRESAIRAWDGETAYVQHAFLEHVDEDRVTAPLGRPLERWLRDDPADETATPLIDPGALDVYACGVNAMVHELERAARAIGVPDERIVAEGFG